MRRILLSLALLLTASSAFAVYSISEAPVQPLLEAQEEFSSLEEDMKGMTIDDFLNLTPKKYKEMTGKKLGVKNAIKLKAAQKFIKKSQKKGAGDIPKGAYIVLAIIGFAWLAMGLMDDFEGNNWWVALLLYFLCWIPGVIYAFVKMDEYY